MVICSLAEGRLSVLTRILSTRSPNATRFPTCKLWTSSSHFASKDAPSGTITIGDVTKPLKKPLNPELVPTKYLPKDEDVHPETLKHLKWIMQKDLLGQGWSINYQVKMNSENLCKYMNIFIDIFLIGRPSPLRRQVAMQYLQLTEREVEYVALSR